MGNKKKSANKIHRMSKLHKRNFLESANREARTKALNVQHKRHPEDIGPPSLYIEKFISS